MKLKKLKARKLETRETPALINAWCSSGASAVVNSSGTCSGPWPAILSFSSGTGSNMAWGTKNPYVVNPA